MLRIEQILKLSKKIANFILKEEEESSLRSLVEDKFDKEDTDYILNDLTNIDQIEKNRISRSALEKSKKESWSKISENINPKPKLITLRLMKRVAAIFIVFLALGLAYRYNNSSDEDLNIENQIVLTTEDGKKQIIEATNEAVLTNTAGNVVANQKDNIIQYNQSNKSEELIYNELYVPYGKKMSLSLADGTFIYLNAGTTLKYPINFIEGQERKVSLIHGEAYFKVAENKKSPFVLDVNDIDVTVLGTHFNVSSYEEDAVIRTVLVEGSVKINSSKEEDNNLLLEPSQMATWHKKTSSLRKVNVDTERYTSWIEGKMIFKGTMFRHMIRKLERNYNVVIESNDEKLNSEIFSATFHVDIETIEQVLDYISNNHPFVYERVSENKIIINEIK